MGDAERAAATPDWMRLITPAMRAEIRALHRVRPWRHAKILVLAGLWAGAAAAAVGSTSLAVRLACWLVIGLCIHGLGVFMHEGAHHNLFRTPWLDRPIGFVCGLPALFSCSCYRATHMLHHRFEHTARDPDNLQAAFPSPTLRSIVYGCFYVAGALMYTSLITVTAPFRAAGWRERLACVVEVATMVGIYAALVHLAAEDPRLQRWLIDGWLAALPFGILVANVRGLAEHTLIVHDDPPNPLRSTRSLPSHPLVSFFFNNQNYHLEHHLFPAVPWYDLPRLHRLLRPLYAGEGAAVLPGYREFLAAAWAHARAGAPAVASASGR